MIFAYDTSCIVGLLSQTHENHTRTSADFDRRLRRKQRLVVVPHTLLETYSVLTGSPAPRRLRPDHALASLESYVMLAQPAPAITVELAFALMQRAQQAGRPGGAIYDAHILQMAQLAGAKELVTWNTKHFLPFADHTIRVVMPGDS